MGRGVSESIGTDEFELELVEAHDSELSGHRPLEAEHRGRRRLMLGLAGVTVLALAVVGVLFGAQTTRNLMTQPIGEPTPITLASSGSTATVTAPGGWHVVRSPLTGNVVGLETPDSRVEITLRLTAGERADGEFLREALGAELPGGAGTNSESNGALRFHSAALPVTETPPAPPVIADGSPATPLLVGVVRPVAPTAESPALTVLVTGDAPLAGYLAEVARVTSTAVFA